MRCTRWFATPPAVWTRAHTPVGFWNTYVPTHARLLPLLPPALVAGDTHACRSNAPPIYSARTLPCVTAAARALAHNRRDTPYSDGTILCCLTLNLSSPTFTIFKLNSPTSPATNFLHYLDDSPFWLPCTCALRACHSRTFPNLLYLPRLLSILLAYHPSFLPTTLSRLYSTYIHSRWRIGSRFGSSSPILIPANIQPGCYLNRTIFSPPPPAYRRLLCLRYDGVVLFCTPAATPSSTTRRATARNGPTYHHLPSPPHTTLPPPPSHHLVPTVAHTHTTFPHPPPSSFPRHALSVAPFGLPAYLPPHTLRAPYLCCTLRLVHTQPPLPAACCYRAYFLCLPLVTPRLNPYHRDIAWVLGLVVARRVPPDLVDGTRITPALRYH